MCLGLFIYFLPPKQSKLTKKIGGIFPHNTMLSAQKPLEMAAKAATSGSF
jgi:hypothetical protein